MGTDCHKVKKDNPTMMLDLKNYTRDFRKYLVVHQFGHALGLEHEHQRLDFWNVIGKHIDIDKMEKDHSTGNYSTEVAFKRDWLPLNMPTHRETECKYDPQSIMHWWYVTKIIFVEYTLMVARILHHADCQEKSLR